MQPNSSSEQQIAELPPYQHIRQNEFYARKEKKQKEEDIAVCVCRYDANDPESACGERCLNVLTSTECTPGYCSCGDLCKNQRFQKCEYAKTKLFQTEGRGWGLLADENIKAGQFIIEYCGEVISWKEAKRRSVAYEVQGLRDAYIICLNASESIDATRKGSEARFINHSCLPNCETRKWNVLGEIRVGIFAKQDIAAETELGYDYNFEWYGGAKVRCLCGATACSGFLGAKSRGFQEDTYLWEDDDDRYSVEKIPLYDSAEDEPCSKLLKTVDLLKSGYDGNAENQYSKVMNGSVKHEDQSESASHIHPVESVPMDDVVMNGVKTEETEASKPFPEDNQQVFAQRNAMISRIRSNSAGRNYQVGPSSKARKRAQPNSNGKKKHPMQEQVDAKHVAQLLASKEAEEELLIKEELKNEAAAQLSSLYDEIRPAIEEHERDNQESVATSVAEKWIEASCLKMKTEFDFYSSIMKSIACTPRKTPDQINSSGADNEVKN